MKIYGFRIIGQCGREWFVPLSMVAADYASFLMNADGHTAEEAARDAELYTPHLSAWFYEQWSDGDDWELTDKLAFKVNTVGKFKTKAARNNARGSWSDATIQEVYIDE